MQPERKLEKRRGEGGERKEMGMEKMGKRIPSSPPGSTAALMRVGGRRRADIPPSPACKAGLRQRRCCIEGLSAAGSAGRGAGRGADRG